MGAHHHSSHCHHGHHDLREKLNFAFALGIALNLFFIVIEVWAGFAANSVALLSDAGHNFGDVLSLLLAWGAMKLSRALPSPTHTYGLTRSTILAALINGLLLLVAVGAIALESVERFFSPEPVDVTLTCAVAFIGLLVNGGTAFLFHSQRRSDLNVQGAFLHMLGDAAVSAGVLISALLISWTGLQWLDAVMSLLIAGAILWSTIGLLKSSLRLLLDAVPDGISYEPVKRFLESLPDVREVHDLHIWATGTQTVALTAHIVRDNFNNHNELIARAQAELKEKFGIHHATLQLEVHDGKSACQPCEDLS